MPTQNIPAPTAAECLHLSVSILGCRASRKINTSFCKPGASGPVCAQHLFPHSVSQVSQGGTWPLSLGETWRGKQGQSTSKAHRQHSSQVTLPFLNKMQLWWQLLAQSSEHVLWEQVGCGSPGSPREIWRVTGTLCWTSSLGKTGCPGERKAGDWRWAEKARGNMTAIKGPGILS